MGSGPEALPRGPFAASCGRRGHGAREFVRAGPRTLSPVGGCRHRRTPLRITPLATLAIVSLLLSACERIEQVIDVRRDLTPHEAYVAALEAAGLAESALGHDWISAADAALATPSTVALPYREEGFIPAEVPTAIGLRMALQRGQVLTVRTRFDASDSTLVFLDLFRVPDESGEPLRPLVRVDSLPDGMVYEPYRDGEYVLRLQPELLRGGRYQVVLSLDPSLSFPVEGLDPRSIGSSFGAPRDGGARDHHGVDIFALRGTLVLAASEGVVTRVEETRRGGRVIWVSDERRGQRLLRAPRPPACRARSAPAAGGHDRPRRQHRQRAHDSSPPALRGVRPQPVRARTAGPDSLSRASAPEHSFPSPCSRAARQLGSRLRAGGGAPDKPGGRVRAGHPAPPHPRAPDGRERRLVACAAARRADGMASGGCGRTRGPRRVGGRTRRSPTGPGRSRPARARRRAAPSGEPDRRARRVLGLSLGARARRSARMGGGGAVARRSHPTLSRSRAPAAPAARPRSAPRPDSGAGRGGPARRTGA